MTLTEFLMARIAEDESVAAAAIHSRPHRCDDESDDGVWTADVLDPERVEGEHLTIYAEGGHTAEHAAHIARWDPARVLAECEAKRRIVEEHGSDKRWPLDRSRVGCRTCRMRGDISVDDEYPCSTLRILAAHYADHPDYDPEWKP